MGWTEQPGEANWGCVTLNGAVPGCTLLCEGPITASRGVGETPLVAVTLTLHQLNASGTVSIQEFRHLWKQLMFYQKVFHKQDTHRSGSLNWAQLQAAMREAGIVLSGNISQLMLIRYGGPDLQMDFVSFVHLMLRVENMEGVFQNLTQDGRGIYLRKPEWLMMSLYS